MSKTIEEAMLRAWQEYRYGPDHEFDPDEPIKPSANFEKGFEAGQNFALAHQWRSVEDELPEDDDTVFVSDENGYHIASYFNGEWYSSDDEFTRNPQMWMPIPSLNPEQR